MKKLLIITLLLGYGNTYAEIVFINDSKFNSIDITYKFCDWQKGTLLCSEENTINIPGSSNLVPHYKTIQYPENYSSINVVRSEEKDKNGQLIAKGKYDYCNWSFKNDGKLTTLNPVFVLNDHESPFITCMDTNF